MWLKVQFQANDTHLVCGIVSVPHLHGVAVLKKADQLSLKTG